MQELLRRRIAGRTVVVGATERVDGDVHPGRVPVDTLRRRQHALTGSTWVMLDQQHGAAVHTVTSAATAPWPLAGAGDVLVAECDAADTLAVWAADCAPLALLAEDGTRVVCHAGWRGLEAGVIDAAADAAGDTVAAVLGPCIHPCCYEFGRDALELVCHGVDLDIDSVSAATTTGDLALDVPAAVAAILARREIVLDVVGPCTGCDTRFFSHRRRADSARHGVVIWIEDAS